MPAPVTLGLVFLNPIYFMLVLVEDRRARGRVFAVGLGAVLGPSLHLVVSDWALMLTGLVAGTAAFAADRLLPHPSAPEPGDEF